MTRGMILLAVLLGLPGVSHAQDAHRHSRAELLGYYTLGGLHLTDTSYTMYLIGKGIGYEANDRLRPFTVHPGVFATAKWTGAALGFWSVWYAFEHNHPKLAWTLLAAQVSVIGWAVTHNDRILRAQSPGR